MVLANVCFCGTMFDGLSRASFSHFCKQGQGFSTNAIKFATRISSSHIHVNGLPHACACYILHAEPVVLAKFCVCGSHGWRFVARICLHRDPGGSWVSQPLAPILWRKSSWHMPMPTVSRTHLHASFLAQIQRFWLNWDLWEPWLAVYRAHPFAYFCKRDQDFSTKAFKFATQISSTYVHVNGLPHASACYILHAEPMVLAKMCVCGSQGWRFIARICLHRNASGTKVSQQMAPIPDGKSSLHIPMPAVSRTHLHVSFFIQIQRFWPMCVFAEAMVDGLSRASVCIFLQAGHRILNKWLQVRHANLKCKCPWMLHFAYKTNGSGQDVSLRKPWLTVYRPLQKEWIVCIWEMLSIGSTSSKW